MATTLYYVFDPLCGWCYGAMPGLAAVRDLPGMQLQPMPSGLFSNEGGRPMDDAFAAYAWKNDRRIAGLTGQRFSERYQQQVLGDRQQRFDSSAATLALTAVFLTAPAKEVDALAAIQQARYVDASDVTAVPVLAELLTSLGLADAAARLAQPDAALLAANRDRVTTAQGLMREMGARGVPALILDTDGTRRLLDHSAMYADPQALRSALLAP